MYNNRNSRSDSESNSIVTVIAKNDLGSLTEQIYGNKKIPSDISKFDKKFAQPIYRLLEDQNASSLSIPKDSLNLLHISAYYDSTECFLLLRDHINPFSQSGEGLTPFHYALANGSYELASLIMNMAETSNDGKNTLQQIFDADSQRENYKYSLPYLAIRSKSNKCLKLLFEKGYDLQHSSISIKKEAMHLAISTTSIQSIEILLQYLKKDQTQQGDTPIILAVKNNETEALRVLLECLAANPATIDSDNKTALYYACYYNNEEAVKLLCDSMVDIDLPRTLKVSAAIHWACKSKNINIIRMVVSKGVDVNRLDDKGETGLAHFIDGKQEDLIKCLEIFVKHGYDINFHMEKKNTILGILLTSCIVKPFLAIEWVLAHGADVDLPLYIKKEKESIYSIRQYMIEYCKGDQPYEQIVDKYILKKQN